MNDVVFWIIAGVILAALIAISILLAANQKKKVIEWLKYAVSMAEKELGEKTGQLKLRRVYDWFIEKFPFLSSLITFEHFSKWVDIALDTLDDWISSKNQIAEYITEKKMTKAKVTKAKTE